MVEKGLTELCGIALDPETIEAIRRFREKFEEEWLQEVPAYKRPPEPPRAQIVVPTDLLVCRRTDEEKHSEAYGRVLNEQAEVLGEQNQGPEFMVIDNGPDTTQRALECLSASLKVVVLDSVLPKPYYKRSGTQFYKTLFEIQRAKA